MPSRSQLVSLLTLGVCLCSPSTRGDTLKITSARAASSRKILSISPGVM